MPPPLEGVTVVTVEQAVAAPLASRHLADMGARVIKVERPGGGDFARAYDSTVRGMSSHFVWLNRGKESVILDLKEPDKLAVLHRLLDSADVFIHNLAPTAAERLNLDPEAVTIARPGLVACAISGYGRCGPYREAKAYDLLIQAEAGIAALTGTPEAPAKAGIPVADIGAGMYAVTGILAALFRRQQTGSGAALHISLFDAVTEWMGYASYYTRYGGRAPPRAGLRHPAIAPYGPFETGSGVEVILAVQNDAEWHAFCRIVLRDATLADDPRFANNDARVAHRQELERTVGAILRTVPLDEVNERLSLARVAFARFRKIEEWLEHPQILMRDRVRAVDTPVGPIEATVPPVDWVGEAPIMEAVPDLGEHTAKVLAELDASDSRPDTET